MVNNNNNNTSYSHLAEKSTAEADGEHQVDIRFVPRHFRALVNLQDLRIVFLPDDLPTYCHREINCARI